MQPTQAEEKNTKKALFFMVTESSAPFPSSSILNIVRSFMIFVGSAYLRPVSSSLRRTRGGQCSSLEDKVVFSDSSGAPL